MFTFAKSPPIMLRTQTLARLLLPSFSTAAPHGPVGAGIVCTPTGLVTGSVTGLVRAEPEPARPATPELVAVLALLFRLTSDVLDDTECARPAENGAKMLASLA